MTAAHSLPPDSPAPTPWEFAGLLLTYACVARCPCCYVCAGPDRAGWMPQDLALTLWRELDELAAAYGRTMRIHLAGGEPFGDWVALVALLRAARDAGRTPVDKIETNAFWAVDDGLTRARLELLVALGVQRLTVSTDVFHQTFVPFERVARCVRIAREVFGKGRVLVRWWDFFNDPVDVGRLTAEERRVVYRAALARHQERLTGRAALLLAPLLPRRPAEVLRGENCAREVLHSRHVHIDLHGNIFPGTCGGIILGRATGRPGRGVATVWEALGTRWREHPIVAAVVTGGSFALLARARPLGYEELPGGYVDKCHLCAHIRQFLVERGLWPAYAGPPACYAGAGDQDLV